MSYDRRALQVAVLTRAQTVATSDRVAAAWRWLVTHWEWLLIGAILLLAGLAHGINMFHFPYFESDEGTYMSQAWAILHEGQLAPYTYWYDHAPGAWIQIAFWEVLTGGMHSLGPSVYSGRVLMLLFQLGSVFLVYRITRQLTHSQWTASVAALLFALDPYGLYFHRRILLDNICAFWMLLALTLVLSRRLTLTKICLSAVALAIAVLSKEVAVVVIPAFIYLVYLRSHPLQRRVALGAWLTLVLSVCSLYVLMAVIKGELFPAGTLLGGSDPHVSLIGSLLYQSSRGTTGGVTGKALYALQALVGWVYDDPLPIGGGTLCMVWALLRMRRKREVGALALMLLALWAFLLRGGVVFGFYIVPLLPLLSILVSLAAFEAVSALRAQTSLWGAGREWWARLVAALERWSARWGVSWGHWWGEPARTLQRWVSPALMILIAVGVVSGVGAGYVTDAHLGYALPGNAPTLPWTNRQADGQLQAVAWVRQNVPANETVVVENSLWVDLRDAGTASVASYPNVQWDIKVGSDPAISGGIFHDDWHMIDYVIITPQVRADATAASVPLVQQAIDHCTIVASFNTGGWPVSVCKVANGRHTPSQQAPASAWAPAQAHLHALLPVARV